MAALPTLTARCALTTAPLATPTWTALTTRVQGFTTDRGRDSELDEFAPGTATVTLKNDDRHLDPANTSSPYTGNLKPRRRFSLQATYNSITYDLFDGHVKNWQQVWSDKHGRAGVPLTDAFEMFQNETFSTDLISNPIDPTGPMIREERAVERSDQRLAFVLDEYGWPAGRRTLGTGRVNIQNAGYEGTNSLTHMRELERAEGGFMFMDAAGNFVLQEKYHRLLNYTTSQATFGDSGVELRYAAFEPDLDVEHIVNHSTGRIANVVEPRVFESTDATSITDYGRTGKTVELWTEDEPETEARTMMYVDFYKQPVYRVKSLTFMPQKDPANLWPQALGRVLGERITVKARYYGTGSVLTHECRIEGIRHEYAAGIWKTTFNLSPVFTQELAGYWILGTSTLGTDTVPAW